ncbi:MAG: YihY/virulence factor BrkB family protein [Candidatus Eisenbacteria bacterium]
MTATTTKPARVWALIQKGVGDFLDNDPFEQAAAVSFYTLLALAPLLLIVLAIAGLVFGHEAVEGRFMSEMRGLLGAQGAKAVQLVIQNSAAPDKSRLSLALGIITLLVGASGVFLQLQSALNRIWGVEAAPKRSAMWRFLRHRLISMAMVFGIGFLLLVSLVVSAALSAISAHYQSLLPWTFVWQGLNALASLLVITLLNAMMFRFLPDVRLAWRDVWLGAFITAVLFTLGKSAIGAYLGHASIGSSYGAAGSLVVLVVWVYYSSLIFFVGAEITQVYSRWREKRIRPTEDAVVVKR